MFRTKFVDKIKTHISCPPSFFFPENCVFYEILLPLALQPAVGYGLSNNTCISPFFPICQQLFPPSHSQHLKIFFYFSSPSFPESFSSSHPFQFLSEDYFGHPILHSLQVTQVTYPLPLYQFYYIFSFTQLF